MEKITENFTLEELTHTNTRLNNTPTEAQREALRLLAVNVLQPLRDLYGDSITVNSGFRSFAVNKAIGGSSTSQHQKGEAADITCDDNRKLFEIIMENLKFDQLINENNYSWIHVSYSATKNRGQILEYKNGKYLNFI